MTVIASGHNIILRDCLPSAVDRFIYWQTHGEWRLLDAPWEGEHTALTAAQETDLRNQFLEPCTGELPSPRKRASIAGNDNNPLGWVSRYGKDRAPETCMIGIDICEDERLDQSLGTEALGLWLEYLFANSTFHRIGLDTWSLNPRMIHVVEKLGFVHEGRQREVVHWDGRRLDMVHFGLLRTDWEEKRMIR